MTCNVGNKDRLFRLIFGALIIAAGVYMHSWWGALGLVPLLTGIFRWCPAYVPFGIKTP